ncbi:hypothetical protein PQR14_36660 [Paraburkholderia bryophila]|uniref:hypothetical protein n=1 Tax=Paraburkholderia bryophila TaxID=420952 RepID=UPI0038B94B96
MSQATKQSSHHSRPHPRSHRRVDGYGDIIETLGEAGIQATGFDDFATIWKGFFPAGQPSFSAEEIAQMTAVFEQVLAQEDWVTFQSNYQTCATLVGEYINNPTQSSLLANIVSELQQLMDLIYNHTGYPGTKLYMSAASLMILVMWLVYLESPDPGALTNIGNSASSSLRDIFNMQTSMFEDIGLESFAAFQQFVFAGEPMDQTQPWAQYIGSDYAQSIINHLRIVRAYTPDSVGQFTAPRLLLRFFPLQDPIADAIWQLESAVVQSFEFIKCNSQLVNNVLYVPVGDLGCTGQIDWQGEVDWQQPDNVPYIAPYPLYQSARPMEPGAPIIYNAHNPESFSFQYVWNDAGSGEQFPDVSSWVFNSVTVGTDTMLPVGFYVTQSHDQPDPNDQKYYLMNAKDLISQQSDFKSVATISFDNSSTVYEDPLFGGYSVLYMDGGQPNRQFNYINPSSFLGFPVDLMDVESV